MDSGWFPCAYAMTHHVITVDPDTSLQEIASVFEQHGIKRVPVVKNGQLVGIVSRANLVQTLATHRLQFFDHAEKDKTVRETVMSRIHGLHQTGSTVDVTVDHGFGVSSKEGKEHCSSRNRGSLGRP